MENSNVTPAWGELAVWDDEIPVGMIKGDPIQEYINDLNKQRNEFWNLYTRAMAQRDTWACIAFGCGVLLGWLLRYV